MNKPDWVRSYEHKAYKRYALCHFGVKGQKWGVHRGPPYPIDRKSKPEGLLEPIGYDMIKNKIIRDAVRSGRVSVKVNANKQMRHTKDGHTEGRSYLNGDVNYAQKLVNELCGTGELLVDENGNWIRKERVTSSETIGVYKSQDGVEVQSKAAMIVYSRTGSHIYPRKEDEQ